MHTKVGEGAERERERKRERIPSRLWYGTEPHGGLGLTNCEIVT